MAATAAQLVVDVTANTKDAEKGLDNVNKKVQDAPSLFGLATKGVLGFVGAAVGIGVVVGGALALFTKMAADSDVKIQETNQLLKSTHGVSGMTAQSIDDLTNRLKDLTGVDDDVVRTATNVLLTFKNIGKEAFPQATQSALDLATFLNKGLLPSEEQVQAASILVGKALNDPIKGMTALQRVGITLSETQKEQIKHFMAVGDVASAQKIILGELESETGGLAETAGNTLPGMLSKLKNTLQDMGKAVGFVVLPVVQAFLGVVLALIKPLGDGLANALQQVQEGFKALGEKLKPLQMPLKALHDGADALWKIFTDNLKPSLDDIGKTLSGMFTPDVKGAADTLTDFITNGVKQAAPFVRDLAKGLGELAKNGLQKVRDFLNSDFVKHLKDVSDNMKKELGPAVKQLGDWFKNDLLPALKEVWPKFQDLANTLVTQVIPAVYDLMLHLGELRIWFAIHILPVLEKIIPPLIQLAGVIAQGLSDAIKNIGPHLKDFGDFLGQSKDKMKAWQPVLDQVGTFIQNVVAPALGNLKDKFVELLPKIKDFGKWVQEHVVPVVKDLAEKFKEAQPHIQQLANDISTRLAPIIKNITEFIQNVALPVLKQIGDWIAQNIQPKLRDFKAFWDTIWPGIQATIETVWGVIQGVITIAWNIISGIIKIGLDILGGNWGQAWEDMKKMFEGVWKGIQQIGRSLFGKLKDWIVEKAGELRDNAVKKFEELKKQAGDKIKELKDNIVKTIQELPGKFKSIGQQMIDNLADAIRSGAGKLGGALKDALHNANNNLPLGLRVPGLASGTDYWPGGLAWVGEGRTAELVVGPHLMNLPRGSQVLPVTGVKQAQPAAASSGGGDTYHITIVGANKTASQLFDEIHAEADRRKRMHG